tara:strand:- start:656 stop:853 length:198 start_codon:yes stop_codon:yes gene_type:complete
MATTDIITALDTVISDKVAGEIDDRELLSRSEIEDFIQSELDYRLEDMVIQIIKNRLSFDVSITE